MFGFQSIGGNIVDTLTALREKRRLEAREAMLDEITRQNAESTRAAQAAQIRASDANVESQLFKDSSEGQEIGSDLTKLDPKVQELYKKRGLFSQSQMDYPPVPPDQIGDSGIGLGFEGGLEGPMTELGQVTTPKYTPSGRYSGSAADRKRVRVDQNVDAFLKKLKQNRELGLNQTPFSEVIMDYLKALEINDTVPYSLFNALQPQAPLRIFDPNSLELKEAPAINGQVPLAGPGDPSIIMGARDVPEPRETKPSDNVLYVAPDGKMYWADPQGKSITPAVMPDGVTGPLRRAGTDTPAYSRATESKVVPPALAGRLGKARGALDMTKGWVYSAGAPGPLGEFNTLAMNAIEYAKSPKVRALAQRIIADPNSWKFTSDQLVEDLIESAKLTEAEQMELADILFQIRLK